jgi:2-methylcitrate dehydratase
VKAFGGKIIIKLNDGTEIVDEKAVANAHPLGATPWKRPDYIRKFEILTDGVLDRSEAQRFLEVAQRLGKLKPEELAGLTVALPAGKLAVADRSGIFAWKG